MAHPQWARWEPGLPSKTLSQSLRRLAVNPKCTQIPPGTWDSGSLAELFPRTCLLHAPWTPMRWSPHWVVKSVTSVGRATQIAQSFQLFVRALYGTPHPGCLGAISKTLACLLAPFEARSWGRGCFASFWTCCSTTKELMYARDETPKPLQHCYLDGSAHFVRRGAAVLDDMH